MGEYLAHWAELDVEVDRAAWVAHLEVRRKGRYPCAVLIPIINILLFYCPLLLSHTCSCAKSRATYSSTA